MEERQRKDNVARNPLVAAHPSEGSSDSDSSQSPLNVHHDFDSSVKSNQTFELERSIQYDTSENEGDTSKVPDMWSWSFVGLYCQYASIGLLYGSTGALLPFCVYSFNGATNVCANAKSISTFAWNLKIFFAILTDAYRPFGKRRTPWMIGGWIGALILLLVLAITADKMSISVWLITLLLVQGFAMFSDVPADGYSVELGQLESSEQRGQILATGQRVRFFFCVVAGLIQAFFLNGPSTNASDCQISFADCWSWGLTINGYYGLLFSIVFVLTIPIFLLKELPADHIPQHDLKYFFLEAWETLKNLTTFYLVIFVIAIQGFTNFTNNASIQLQYYVIKLTNFQAGIDTVTTYASLVLAIWIFQKYMINRNWRYTQIASTVIGSCLGLIWLLPFYNVGGTRNPWFTIFIDLDTNFAAGLSQVLYSMAVIELARPGQEATTYELLVTVGNSALLVNGIVSTQLLTPFKAVGCNDDDADECGSHTVDTTNSETFDNSDGPNRFTYYTLVLSGIALISVCVFVNYLPRSKEECHDWRKEGEALGTSVMRGKVTLVIVSIVIAYGIIAAVLLLDTQTSCLPEVGGSGCS